VFEVPEGKSDPQVLKKVETFVKEMGSKMAYNVAADGPDNFMANAWMRAAEQGAIPTAFVINTKGQIAWIGHPMELEGVLPKIVSGKWDIDAEKERAEKAEEDFEKRTKMFEPLQKALASHDERQVVAELDKLFAQDPRLEEIYGSLKFDMLLVADEPKAYDYARKLYDGLYKGNPTMLNNIAWAIVDDANNPEHPDYALAIKLAQRAVDVDKGKSPYFLDTLAYAYFKSGEKAKGIELSEKAVALAEKDESFDKEVLTELKTRLEMMKKKAKG
jgi:tetratricopeptide (TPR) repeat protein